MTHLSDYLPGILKTQFDFVFSAFAPYGKIHLTNGVKEGKVVNPLIIHQTYKDGRIVVSIG